MGLDFHCPVLLCTISYDRLLGARYTFPSWRLNDVPIPMFLATHAYFCFYHTLTNMALRRLRRSRAYVRGARARRFVLDAALIARRDSAEDV